MSRGGREHKKISSEDDGGGGGHGGGDSRWLVTYADLLTLLMVLFLVLWVISTIDLAKFEKFKSGLGDFGNPAATAAGGGAGTGEEPCATAIDTAAAEGDSHSTDTAAAEGDSHSTDTAAAEGDSHSTDTEAPAEETAATEAPAEESATTEAPAEETAATEVPAEESATTEAPAEETATTEAPAEGDSHSTDTAAAEGDSHSTDAAAEDGGHGATTEAPADPCLGEGEAGTPGPGGGAATSGGGAGTALTEGDLPALADKVQEEIDAAGLPDVISVSVEERGLVIMVTTDNVLFGSGAADVSLDGAAMIGAIATTLNEFTNSIVVEGHTDKRPLRRVGYDNWDLSVDRAVSVVKLLKSVYGIDPERLSARGFGETHPIDEGEDEAAFARNRRVEIVVLAQTAAEAGTATTEAPTEGASTEGATTEGGATGTESSVAPAEGETVTTDPAAAETPSTDAPSEG